MVIWGDLTGGKATWHPVTKEMIDLSDSRI